MPISSSESEIKTAKEILQKKLLKKQEEPDLKFKSGVATKEELDKLKEERDRSNNLFQEYKKDEKNPQKEAVPVVNEIADKINPEPEIIKTKEKTKDEKRKQAEHYGFKDAVSLKAASGGFLNVLGSISGARLAWELPKLGFDIYKKGEAKTATQELLDAVIKNSIQNKNFETSLDVKLVKNKNEEEILEEKLDKLREGKEKFPIGKNVREKIASFNEKLKNIKLPEKEKQDLRDQMAKVLWEHRHFTENIGKKRAEKVGKVFDIYASNSAQVMTVAKEVVNTASVWALMPWLRGIGYAALSGVDSIMKASNAYAKENFNKGNDYVPAEKRLPFIFKAITVGSLNKTYNNLIGNFFKKDEKGEKMGFGKAALGSFVAGTGIAGSAMRLAGVVEFEQALQSGNVVMQEGGKKFMEALQSGQIVEALKQGGENWVYNAQRLLHYIHLSDDPNKTINNLTKGFVAGEIINAENNPQLPHIEAPISEAGVGAGNNLEAQAISAEQLKDATIGKGEGVIHTFTRQIEHNPQAFGYQGDVNDGVELHKFAQGEAYRIAVEDGYVDVNNGTEIRVLDSNETTQFILNPTDHSVTEVNANTYIEDTREITKNTFDEADKIIKNITETTETGTIIHEVYSSNIPQENTGITPPPEVENQNLIPQENISYSPAEINNTESPKTENIDNVNPKIHQQIEEWQKTKGLRSNDFISGIDTSANDYNIIEKQNEQIQENIKDAENIKTIGPDMHQQMEEWKKTKGLRSNDFISGNNEVHNLNPIPQENTPHLPAEINKIESSKTEYIGNLHNEINIITPPETSMAFLEEKINKVKDVNKHIEDIYKYKWWIFHGNQNKWPEVKDLKVEDVINGKFSQHDYGGIGFTEVHNREQMQNYLKELQKNSTLPINPLKNGETVGDYILRANHIPSFDENVLIKEHIEKLNDLEIYRRDGESTKDFIERADEIYSRHMQTLDSISTGGHHTGEMTLIDKHIAEEIERQKEIDSLNESLLGKTHQQVENTNPLHSQDEISKNLENFPIKKGFVDGNNKLTFLSDGSGKTEIKIEGFQGIKEHNEMFNYMKDDWRGIILDNSNIINSKGVIDNVNRELSSIYLCKKFLDKFTLEGEENSQEAIFLKEVFVKKINSLESRYGDIFKDIPEILKIKSK
ncbi:MAG: hypothetical protein ABH971_00175 [bacterium]